jgi:acyl-coenzyme A thioesterase PaaI-like protein
VAQGTSTPGALPGWEPPPQGGAMPPHTPPCMVCGPDAPAGYHLPVRRDGEEVRASFAFGPAHEGGPGLAHGGAVAAVCDDLLGHVLTLVGVPAVTRSLQVEYLAPVVLGQAHELRARLVEHDGRTLWIEGEGTVDGAVRFTARGLFVQVGLRHFLAGLTPDQRERAEAYLASQETDGVHAP